MTRKQIGIIFTLMALIVCVGVLSMKLNENGLMDSSDLGQLFSQSDKETLSTQDYLYNLRSQKEQSDAKFVSDLQALVNSTTATDEQKEIANNSLIQKTQITDQENRVELNIKNKGYEDALCMIDSNKVKVYVKIGDEYSQENAAMIQKIVEDVTALNDITIEAKK